MLKELKRIIAEEPDNGTDDPEWHGPQISCQIFLRDTGKYKIKP